jgi:hypothetical protein
MRIAGGDPTNETAQNPRPWHVREALFAELRQESVLDQPAASGAQRGAGAARSWLASSLRRPPSRFGLHFGPTFGPTFGLRFGPARQIALP